ncbi:hypothetical protein EV421DRAFT_1695372, partial [Armillaria borealis]
AMDKIDGHVVPAELRDDLLNRDTSALQSKGSLPSYIPFYIGMPVILWSRNISTDLKVTNGAQGILRHLQMAIDPHGKQYTTCALVEFPNCGIELDGIPPNCFPIKPTTWHFNEKIKNAEGEYDNVRVTREQLPFQPGFALTGQVAQGQ